MRYLGLLLVLLAVFPAFAQDETILYTTTDGKFQFEIPADWEFMKEEEGRVFLVHVGDVAQYTTISIGMTDTAPMFENNLEAVQFMLGSEATLDDFEAQQIGDYKVLIQEVDGEEIDTIFAIILMEDGVVGVLKANVLDSPVELDFLRPIAESIIASITYIEPASDPFDELDLISPDISELTASYESESGLFAFDYPEDWVIEDYTDVILLATSELTATSAPDMGIQFGVSHNPTWSGKSEAFLHFLLNSMMDYVSSSEDAYIVDFNLDGRHASRVQDDSTANEIVLLALALDDDIFVAMIGAPSDYDSEEAESIMFAIASTLRVIEPDRELIEVDTSMLTETYSGLDGRYTFNYPDDWVLDTSGELVQLYSTAEGEPDTINDNQVILTVNVFSKSKEEEFDANATLVEVAETIQSPTRLESTPAMEIMINDTPAVVMDMGMSGMDGIVIYVSLNNDLVGQVIAFANPGDFEQYKEIILAITSSIKLGN